MKSDRLSGTIFMALSAMVFLYIWGWPREAGLYPQLVCGLLFALGALLTLFPKDLHIKTLKTMLAAAKENRMVLYISLLTVIFILSINHLGFFVALPPFLAAGQLMMGSRSTKQILISSILITAFIYIVFVLILTIQIPVAFWMM